MPKPNIPDALWITLDRAVCALQRDPRAPTSFGRYWSAVGEVEDYAAMAETPAEQSLAELMRWRLARALRKYAPYDALSEEARAVEAFLESPHRKWR